MKKLIPYLIILLVLGVFSSCQKEEIIENNLMNKTKIEQAEILSSRSTDDKKEECNLAWTINVDDPCCITFFVSASGDWSVDLGFGDVVSGSGNDIFEHCYDSKLPSGFNAIFNCGQFSKLVPLWNPECEEEECNLAWTINVDDPCCITFFVSCSGDWSVDLGFGDVITGSGNSTFEHCFDAQLPPDFKATFNYGQTSKSIPLWTPECEKKPRSCCKIENVKINQVEGNLYEVCVAIVAPPGSILSITIHGQTSQVSLNSDCDKSILYCKRFEGCETNIVVEIIGPKGVCDSVTTAIC